MNREPLKISLYRPEIDGLRALAVIAVIIYHFNKDILPSGFLGVDVFFVISGYVIISSLLKTKSGNLWNFVINFYSRRIIRLMPALIFFIIIFCICLVIIIPQTGSSLKTAISSLFGVSNIYLFNYSTDYFAQENELNVFMHTWSLGVESQFYFIFPFIVWFSSFNKEIKSTPINIWITLILLSTLSLISFINIYDINPPAAYFLTHNRLWEIALGSITFLIANSNTKFKNQIEKIPNLLLIIGFLVVMSINSLIPTISHIIIVLITSLLLIALIKKDFIYKLLVHKSLLYLGKISYSLYLWHWGIISISRWTIGIHWWSVPIQLFLIYFFADLSFKFIECPFREKSGFNSNCLNIKLALLTILGSSAFIYFLGGPFKGIIYIGSKENINNFSEKDYWNFKFCKSDNLETNKVSSRKYEKCWVGNNGYLDENNNSKSIFIFGNSYNAMLMPIAAEIFKSGENINFNSFYRVGCLPSLNVNYKKDGVMGSCSKTFDSYLNFFYKKSKENDSLIIVDSFRLFMKSSKTKLYYRGKEISQIEALKIYFDELIALSKKLSQENKNLIITSPIPAIRNNPLICVSKLAKTNNLCKLAEDKIYYDIEFNKQMDLINFEMKKLEEYQIIYLNFYEELQKLIKNDLENIYYYYSDTEHLTRKAALKLTNYFKFKIIDSNK